jgi:hypothetical protein
MAIVRDKLYVGELIFAGDTDTVHPLVKLATIAHRRKNHDDIDDRAQTYNSLLVNRLFLTMLWKPSIVQGGARLVSTCLIEDKTAPLLLASFESKDAP